MNHKTWLDNEYAMWIKALQESTVHNFKEHAMVKRMLGEPVVDFKSHCEGHFTLNGLDIIDSIGRKSPPYFISGMAWRMIYYAEQILKRKPSSIIEIGGGIGQFCAILTALGYKGTYFIYDQPEVQDFQMEYLEEVEKQTGLITPKWRAIWDYCVSFYALGEFNDELKEVYIKQIVNKCPHGYIAWNPHSGATDDLTLFTHDIKVTEGREPNIKIIEW